VPRRPACSWTSTCPTGPDSSCYGTCGPNDAAEGEEKVLAEAQRLGAALLTKPFSPKKLTAQVAAMLGDPPPSDADEGAGSDR
jgi:hypothetical protein